MVKRKPLIHQLFAAIVFYTTCKGKDTDVRVKHVLISEVPRYSQHAVTNLYLQNGGNDTGKVTSNPVLAHVRHMVN